MAVSKRDILDSFTQRLQLMLDSGHIPPWQKPWTPQFGPEMSRPHNPVTGRAYSGLNRLDLTLSAALAGYADPRWVGYRQAAQAGWQVRKGEKSATIHLPVEIILNKKDNANTPSAGEGETERSKRLVFKRVPIFNAQQIDGMPPLAKVPQQNIQPKSQELATLTHALGVKVVEVAGSGKAYYSPARDFIHLPERNAFHDQHGYDSTLAHELTHASGHASRLARDLTGSFGSALYAAEEITAEVGSYLLCQELGVPYAGGNPDMTEEQHAAYAASWAEVLKTQPEKIGKAIDLGVKASLYLGRELTLALTPEIVPDKVPTPSTEPALTVGSGLGF
ncbi:MAG: zincin-like metallopeptidase domain-containing protein [Thiobacillaceae bacterium]